jgi:hypothetical protein
MSQRFAYLVAEGVTDVTLITAVLKKFHGLTQVAKIQSLDAGIANWLDDKSYSWPVGGDISRHAVPAPVFLQDDDRIVAVCNARGIKRIGMQLERDFEALSRPGGRLPVAVGIVLDSDGELDSDGVAPSDRFASACEVFRTNVVQEFNLDFPMPTETDNVAVSPEMRFGVFVIPGGDRPGTLEDVLLPLGKTRFPKLFDRAETFVRDCVRESVLDAADGRELRKPKGPDKATISAAVSLLKPGKNINASLQDNDWLPDDPENSPIASLNAFLGDLIRPDG